MYNCKTQQYNLSEIFEVYVGTNKSVHQSCIFGIQSFLSDQRLHLEVIKQMFNWYFREKLEIHELFYTNRVNDLLNIVYLYLKLLFRYQLIRHRFGTYSNVNTGCYATNTPSSLLLHLFIDWSVSYYFYFGNRILVKELELHTINNKGNILYSISSFNHICRQKYLGSRIVIFRYQLIVFLYSKCIN